LVSVWRRTNKFIAKTLEADSWLKFSVIVPVYNRRDELDRCLRSLSKQTFNAFEVIVCDDGSEVPVIDVIDKYSPEIPIKLIRIDNSGGPARPRNKALKEAVAPWVAFLDSDDWWFPTRLELLAKHLSEEVDVIYHPLKVVSDGNKKTRYKHVGRPILGDALYQMAVEGNPIPLSGALVRRELLGKNPFDETDLLKAYEDFDLWLSLAAKGAAFDFLDEPLGVYWEGTDSISRLSLGDIKKCNALYKKHCENYVAFKHQAESWHFLQLSSIYYRLGLYDQAISEALAARSLVGTKSCVKRWFFVCASWVKIIRQRFE
jgi:glycosyltransferase involved in cell wall biosynthesis